MESQQCPCHNYYVTLLGRTGIWSQVPWKLNSTAFLFTTLPFSQLAWKWVSTLAIIFIISSFFLNYIFYFQNKYLCRQTSILTGSGELKISQSPWKLLVIFLQEKEVVVYKEHTWGPFTSSLWAVGPQEGGEGTGKAEHINLHSKFPQKQA